jgi:hypothetical protein
LLSAWSHTSYISLFIVSTGLWEVPPNVCFAFHDIVFSNFPSLSKKAIKAISFELMKVICNNVQLDINFFVHTVTNGEIDLETLVSYSLFHI